MVVIFEGGQTYQS